MLRLFVVRFVTLPYTSVYLQNVQMFLVSQNDIYLILVENVLSRKKIITD